MANNLKIRKAMKNKKDEFYTLYEDIKEELDNYKKFFFNKIIYCNCDSKESNFVKYFENNFLRFKLKDLIYTSDDCFTHEDLIKKSDIVCTNPPFSLFRKFVDFLIKNKKDFIILGNYQNFFNLNIFRYLKNKKIFPGFGFNKTMFFEVPKCYEGTINPKTNKKEAKVTGIAWFTNFLIKRKIKPLNLTLNYDPEVHLKCDDNDFIFINKTKEIPKDYEGIMGVPISFIDFWNPKEFEIVGMMKPSPISDVNLGVPMIKGKYKYGRILIKKILKKC